MSRVEKGQGDGTGVEKGKRKWNVSDTEVESPGAPWQEGIRIEKRKLHLT